MSTNSTSKRHQTGKEELLELIEPVCADAGYELVDIDYKAGGQGGLLRVYIDYPAGSEQSISFADCEKLSHELSAVLDVEDAIAHKYNLEVSSPGIDRPLRTADHFRRFIGEEAKVSLRSGIEGRRNFKGSLLRVSDDSATVTLEVDGIQHDLPLADLATAKLVPDWDLLMKNRGKRA